MARSFPSQQQSENSFTQKDWLVLAALTALCLFWSLFRFRWDATPMEDASMLIRYAQNLANGYGLRWNPHLAPVDGATDFLYAVATGALAHIARISAINASRFLNLGAQLYSCLLLYTGARRLFGASRWVCALLVCYLIAGPAWKMAETCFGAPLFAAALLTAWYFGLTYALRRSSNAHAIGFGISALISGLIRPEGVLIGIFLAVACLYLMQAEARKRFLAIYITCMVLLGTPYFLWHWHYYHYPLPNPFYVKGSGHLYPASMQGAAVHLAVYLAPFIPLFPLGYLRNETRRFTNTILAVLIAYTAIWILLVDWNNHFFRFQYAIVPLTLLALAGIATGIRITEYVPSLQSPSRAARGVLVATFLLFLFVTMGYIDRQFTPWYDTTHGMRDFAGKLQPFAANGYTMAVTEAGALPLYSQWQAIDLLGLNDAVIAHGGTQVIPGYLERTLPELIMTHVDAGTAAQREALAGLRDDQTAPPGYEKFMAAAQFAHRNHYILAAAYGVSICNLHLFWVRPDAPRANELVHIIRTTPYYFLDNGYLTHDFRNEIPPPAPCTR